MYPPFLKPLSLSQNKKKGLNIVMSMSFLNIVLHSCPKTNCESYPFRFYSTLLFYTRYSNILQRVTSQRILIKFDIIDSKFEKWGGKTTFARLFMFIKMIQDTLIIQLKNEIITLWFTLSNIFPPPRKRKKS